MVETWTVTAEGTAPIGELENLLHILEMQRNIGDPSVFYEPRYDRDVHDPLLLYGMQEAVNRIYGAVENGERILVYGDYDADGITGTAVQMDVLRQLGATVSPWLPHRIETGYGLSSEVLEQLGDSFDVLITVDCGVANVAEIADVKAAGKDVIVVDHHELPEAVPEALAVLHPRHPKGAYPFGWLCGAGVSWKLATALLRDERSGIIDADAEKWLLDLVCLGTVADMVSLTGENRAIATFGLEVLRRSKRPGIRALLDGLRDDDVIDEETVGFRIVPMLNAAGRIDHPQPALDLLLAESEEEATELVRMLNNLNQRRRTLSKRIQTEAEQVVSEDSPVVFAADASWSPGVVGLVAGRLAEKYAKPAFVVGGAQGEMVGSARAPDGYNLLSFLETAKDSLLKFGGHTSAAGFTVLSNGLENFRDQLLLAGGNREAVLVTPKADCLVETTLLDRETLDALARFAPYGIDNPRPMLAVAELELADWRPVGKTQEHAKLTFRVEDDVLPGIGFGLVATMQELGIKIADTVAVIGELTYNEWRGFTSVQLVVDSIAPSRMVRFVTKNVLAEAGV